MLKAITPGFIHRIDNYLLIHHPVLWSSKVHFALWHGAVLWLLSAFVGFILPIDLHRHIEYGLWYFLFTVPGVILLCLWIYHYVIFNKEKNYGSKKVSDEYLNFALVFVITAFLLMAPWPFEIVYSSRVANSYDANELLTDIDILNETNPYIPNESYNYTNWQDSSTQKVYFSLKSLNRGRSAPYTPYSMLGDTGKYPQLQTEYQLWYKYKPSTDISFLKKKIELFARTAEKYGVRVYQSSDSLAAKYVQLLKREWIPAQEFYASYPSYESELNTVFTNVCTVKFQTWFIFEEEALWVLFYFVMCITVFLVLFKIVYWKQFLIMLVVMIVYPIITFILSQLMPYDVFMSRNDLFSWSVVLLLIFSIISMFITAYNHWHYQPFYNIFNQVLYVSIIFLPLLVISMLHEYTNIFHNHDYHQFYDYMNENVKTKDLALVYENVLDGYYFNYWAAEYSTWCSYMRLSGIALFILGAPFLKELFVRQLALPKRS